VRRLARREALERALAQSRFLLDLEALSGVQPEHLRHRLERSREALHRVARRFFEHPDQTVENIEASLSKRGLGETLRALTREPSSFGRMSARGRDAYDRFRAFRARGGRAPVHLLAGSHLTDAVARYALHQARLVAATDPGIVRKGMQLQGKHDAVRSGQLRVERSVWQSAEALRLHTDHRQRMRTWARRQPGVKTLEQRVAGAAQRLIEAGRTSEEREAARSLATATAERQTGRVLQLRGQAVCLVTPTAIGRDPV